MHYSRILTWLTTWLFVLGFFALSSASFGQTIQFVETSHDFDYIYEGDVVTYVFEYVNEGDKPLILSDVKVSCGCTIIDWNKTPLMPGQRTTLTVKFESQGRVGKQSKTVSVFSNDPDNAIVRLQIMGLVIPK
jgi:hypothetical protein